MVYLFIIILVVVLVIIPITKTMPKSFLDYEVLRKESFVKNAYYRDIVRNINACTDSAQIHRCIGLIDTHYAKFNDIDEKLALSELLLFKAKEILTIKIEENDRLRRKI